MKGKLLIILTFLISFLSFSQEINKIEFHYSNSVIIGSETNIIFESVKKNRRNRVKIITERKNDFFTQKITQKKFLKLCKAISKINTVTYNLIKGKDSIKYNCIDGSDIIITTFQNNIKKQYFIECLASVDKDSHDRKDFWYAVQLIAESVGIRIEDLY
ncbi:hypothetical protein [Chryseobacterium lathyri]|jgi:lysyl-tRNA synthetase class I|uniref:Uncharacterized protein n=1 Tax=Chryseobacterium lathyri TaxID=395933 RepID=A0A511Y6P5_9FLAO|nr:hypothetical protein [Chryseobacterium lathyri]GEN70860.1 hypothetical protein CLA01_09320 [Chryseobacterium lathyri]